MSGEPKEASLKDIEAALLPLLDKTFTRRMLDLITRRKSGEIEWGKVECLDKSEMVPLEALPEVDHTTCTALLKKAAILKLNGGLGTSMGLTCAKAVVVAKDGKTFLQVTLETIRHQNKKFGCSVPVVFMNSFNTEAATKEQAASAKDLDILHFNQEQFPRLVKQTLLPLPKTKEDTHDCWYPPGHGSVYDCLLTSGTLDELVKRGIEYLFISNIDNLGATLDERILKHFAESKSEVLMELTAKTPDDVKGGTVIHYPKETGERGFKLLEIAQVPKEYTSEFKSVRKFSVFNTNNLWIRLPFLKQALLSDKIKLDVISNPKKVGSVEVMQFETACGAIASCVQSLSVVTVPRLRFISTKKSSDLLLCRSNFWVLTDGFLSINPKRNFPSFPLLSLDKPYADLAGCLARFDSTPDMVELESLTIVGNVFFGSNIVLRGNIVILAKEGEKIMIPSGAILDNCTIHGSLTITPRA